MNFYIYSRIFHFHKRSNLASVIIPLQKEKITDDGFSLKSTNIPFALVLPKSFLAEKAWKKEKKLFSHANALANFPDFKVFSVK